MMELFRALAVLAEPPREEARGVAEALELGELPPSSEYTEVFVFQLYPYASVYLGAEGMLGGEARDLVAGFWRALGQTPPTEADHLAVVLALYARLAELEEGDGEAARRASWRGARKAFLWEHLLSWLPAYVAKLDDIAPPFYRRWGELLMKALLNEADVLGRQNALPLHLREAHALVDPRGGGAEEFRQSLLSPARSGMILVRSDLSRAARELQLGLRAGERKFILQSLFNQDATMTLEWLAAEARVWTKRHRQHAATLGDVADAWASKATATATLMRELKPSAEEVA
ncbi:MAG TPA: molecular chaperone TorD family protein [Pyrinomonadaceae bacterium]|jgi:TorA maturation chaperone TorD